MEKDNYRFDDVYHNVYELSNNTYVYIGNYYAFGLTVSMSYKSKEQKVLSYLR